MNSDTLNTDTVPTTNLPPDSLQRDSLHTGSTAPASLVLDAKTLGLKMETGTVLPVNLGDTFDVSVTVSWSVQGSSLLLVPASTASGKGLNQLAVRQELGRTVKDGKEISENKIIYTVVASDTGNLNIPPLRLTIPTQQGPMELRSEAIPVRVNAPSNMLPLIAALVAFVLIAIFAFLRIRRRAKNRAATIAVRSAEEMKLYEEFRVLKQRVNTADSREWLLALEKICKSWAMSRFGEDDLDALAKAEKLDGWAPLLEEFTHARYGGGQRDAFMNRETWKIASRLMQMTEDE